MDYNGPKKSTIYDKRASDNEYEDGGDSLLIRPQQNFNNSRVPTTTTRRRERNRPENHDHDDQNSDEFANRERHRRHRNRHFSHKSKRNDCRLECHSSHKRDKKHRHRSSHRSSSYGSNSIRNSDKKGDDNFHTEEMMPELTMIDDDDDDITKVIPNLQRDSEEETARIVIIQQEEPEEPLPKKPFKGNDDDGNSISHVSSFLKDMEGDDDYYDDVDKEKELKREFEEEMRGKIFTDGNNKRIKMIDSEPEELISDERTCSVGSEEGLDSSLNNRSSEQSRGMEQNSDDFDEVDDDNEEETGRHNITTVGINVLDESLPPYYPAIEGCRSVEEFQCLNRIEEGTYGVVYRFKDKRNDDIVALKKLKMEKQKECFPITSLREINTLLKSQHPNIVTVREIVVGNNMDKIFIVMDYVEHDMKSLIEHMRVKEQKFLPGEVKCLLKQLLLAVAHLHDNWILHRDLKTSNLLLSHKGILKVGDFGLAREYGSPLKPYTPIVVTLWYRAPELLLGCQKYSTPIDLWSVGCIFAEFLQMNALFPGKSEVEQINRIYKILGTPTEELWPGYGELPAVQKVKFVNNQNPYLNKKFQSLSVFTFNLLTNFLTYDPAQRISAENALKHSYFGEFPTAIDPSQFPKWPAKSEGGRGFKRQQDSSPKPPSGGGEFKKLGDEDGFRIGAEPENVRMGGGFSLKF